MQLSDNPFLEDLFPTPRAPKGSFKREFETVKSTAAFRFSALGSKTKAAGVVNGRPEVVIRLGRPNVRSYSHLVKTADYIARHGDVEVEDQSGQIFTDKAEYRKILYQWKLASDMGEGEAKYGHARRIILSMPVGVDEEKFQKSCRQWAKDMLPGYDYLIAFHLKSNDKKTHQPHCHILLRTVSKDGKRFHLDNQETAAFREHFASCLLKNGIEANATRRWSRGKTIKSVSQADYHVARNRVMTNEERARIYAMSKKRNLLNHQKERMQRIADAFEIGAEIEDPDGIVQAKKTRKKVIGLANGAAQQLLRSQNQADRELGKKLKIHYDNLSPVESAQQKMLRKMNEERAQQIRRLQAMRKRKRFERGAQR